MDAPDPGPLPCDLVVSKEILDAISAAVERLPTLNRAAFELMGVRELTETEAVAEMIAAKMPCSISQIRGYYFRARQLLRDALLPYLRNR